MGTPREFTPAETVEAVSDLIRTLRGLVALDGSRLRDHLYRACGESLCALVERVTPGASATFGALPDAVAEGSTSAILAKLSDVARKLKHLANVDLDSTRKSYYDAAIAPLRVALENLVPGAHAAF